MSSRRKEIPVSDSSKQGSSGEPIGATPESSKPSHRDEILDKKLQASLPEDFKQLKTYDDLCKWIHKDDKSYNDFIEMCNCFGTDKLRREKYRPTIYSIVINDDILAGKEWKFVKVGFTQIDTKPCSKNRMETVMDQITKYKGSDVLFKLPIRAIDTTRFLDTEERIRKSFGFLVDKKLAKALNLPVKTEWVLNSQENINDYKKKEKELKATKTTAIFKDNPCLEFVKTLKDTSRTATKEEFERWLKENKKFPKWLGLREKKKTFEVYQQSDMPVDLAAHLEQHKKATKF